MDIQEKIRDTGIRLLDENLVQGTWGNISLRVETDYMYVTPSGLDYTLLKPEDIIKVNIHTLKYQNKGLKPTSEKGIHAGILKARKEINALIHSHPSACSVFAAAHKPLIVIDKGLQTLFNTDIINCTKYALPSTHGLTVNTIRAMGNANAVFMVNHGVMCCGESLEIAFEVLKQLEKLAQLYLKNAFAER